MDIMLIPIGETLDDNKQFAGHAELAENLHMTIMFFARVGYSPPWIGYYAMLNGEFVGSGAFKGRPLNGMVEIAYGTFPTHQHKGVGTHICKALVEIAIRTDPSITISARTLREESYSTHILRKNNFVNRGTVKDPEDGKVWEWVYDPLAAQ